ncbi:ABC transporter ATP-binding protein [Kribbella sp. NPDC004875]|uniref:ABC transporter ATP-binding protein n=1 Tax=Kribbella sp. NPDC004875 TaxID=3364107 RepID=UPI003687F610
MSTPLMEVRGLSKVYRRGGLWSRTQVNAVRDLSMTIDAGQIVALVGESGSGKTTAGRILARLVRPTAGTVEFEGRPAGHQPEPTVQMIFQDVFGSLNPAHSVGHHLRRAIVRSAHEDDVDKTVAELLGSVGLRPAERFAKRYSHELSGGQRQRVGIARALAPAPRLVIADEPVSMLDMSVRVDILNLLAGLREKRGVALLYITHDLVSARYLADRITVMFSGYGVESAPATALLDEPQHPYTRLLLASVPGSTTTPTKPTVTKPTVAKPATTADGCPFVARCPLATEQCATVMPPVTTLPGDRWVRCHAVQS